MPPWWGLAAVGGAVLLTLWWSYATSVGRPKGLTRFVLVLLRLLAVALAVLCFLDPQWIERVEHRKKARVAVLLDTSRSMSIQDASADARLADAKAWVQESLMPMAPGHVSVMPFQFHESLASLTNLLGGAAAAVDSASPTGGATAIAAALETLLSAQGGEPLIGAVLCSDGVDTSASDPLAAARLFRRKGIPIHTVRFGTTNEMRDIIVENVQVKRALSAQAPTRVVVSLFSPGYGGFSKPVQIRYLQQVLAQQNVVLNGDRQRVELEFKPQAREYRVYNVHVPVQTGEWLATNNRRPFGLEVIDPTIRVIYMEGTPMQDNAPQPEWRYLKSALETDPQIKVRVLYRTRFRGLASAAIVDSDPVTGEAVYPVEHPTKGYPRTQAELLQYDVVIHSDIPKDLFTAEQMDYTARLVEEHGGGFVMIGGKSAFGTGGYHRTVLDRFIPVAMESGNDTLNQPFKMGIPREVLNHPLIAIGANRDETAALWTAKLPNLYGLNRVSRAKPGATVLAVHPTERNAGGPLVVMAVQEVGKGRTMAFTSDITRTWGKDYETEWGEPTQAGAAVSEYNCDQRYYQRFWINAVRWLAANRLGRTNSPVLLELDQTVLRPGAFLQPVVKVLDAAQRPTSAAEVRLTLSAPGTVDRVEKAEFDPAVQAFRAKLELKVAGDFTVRAEAFQKGVSVGNDKQMVVCEQNDLEMLDVRARPEVMAGIARASGGLALAGGVKDFASLRAIYGGAPPVTVEMRRNPMWDKLWMLASIVGLLTCEWILRRLRGLA
jgi:uncharacterized membrane protein